MLARVLSQVAAFVAVVLVLSTIAFIGRERLHVTRKEWRSRLRRITPAASVLVVVLLFNRVARQRLPAISWEIDFNMTSILYKIEGETILWFQSYATPELTAYFTFIYVYAYAFMLVFPVVAYFALADTRYLRKLLAAYTLNYSIGLVFYVLVIAYGPRNVMPELFDTVLYDTNPQYQYLTREVNRNVNVFPSLHTSLSATIAAFAYRTRKAYPKWFPVAVFLAISVATSTMYLAIHWTTDVLAGLVLAYVSVVVSERAVGRWSISTYLTAHVDSFRTRLRSLRGN